MPSGPWLHKFLASAQYVERQKIIRDPTMSHSIRTVAVVREIREKEPRIKDASRFVKKANATKRPVIGSESEYNCLPGTECLKKK